MSSKENFQLDVRVIESLEKAGAIEDLLTIAPVVGPGDVISSDIELMAKFSEGRAQFYKGNYEYAARIFCELNEALPDDGRFINTAKINETFCWLHLGKFSEYRKQYEPLAIQNRVYGVVLWNLVVACYRIGLEAKAESYLQEWFKSATPYFLSKGCLLLSVLQLRKGKTEDALSSLNKAFMVDNENIKRILSKYLSQELMTDVFGPEASRQNSDKIETHIESRDEVLSSLKELLIARPPGKYPQIAHILSEFEYQSGYIAAIEKFGDGDIDASLKIIESLLKGTRENEALLWAKADCFYAKRQWREGIALIENQLSNIGLPGGVLWNVTCAYFNLGEYKLALDNIKKCLDLEYRNSSAAWLAQGLLAHLCGDRILRDDAIIQALRISPKQSIFHLGILKNIGIDLERLASLENIPNSILRVDEKELAARQEEVIKNAQDLVNKDNAIEAARQFLQLAPESLTDIPEIGDITFMPVFLPTCPAKLYDVKEIFLAGVAAFQQGAYPEAILKFEDLYSKTHKNYQSAVNLAASLILAERYSRAIDILIDTIEFRKSGGAYAIRNLISAYIRSEKQKEAFYWFGKLIEVSQKENFNFVQMAYIAHLIGKYEDVAALLFNACTETFTESTIQLKGAAIKACLNVGDISRAIALMQYFVGDKPLPINVVAGKTTPILSPNECIGYSPMKRQYDIFTKHHDTRGGVAYFQEVYLARKVDYNTCIDFDTVDGLFNSCMFYGRSLLDNKEFDKAHEILRQAFSLLVNNSSFYPKKELSIRYFALTNVYFTRGHYFWARELCERGLAADNTNPGLIEIRKKIEKRSMEIEGFIEMIPKNSREAMKELYELCLSYSENRLDFLGLLPKVISLIDILPQDFPKSRSVIFELHNLIDDLIRLDNVPMNMRRKEITKQKEITTKIEQDIQFALPRTFFSAMVPVLEGIRKTLDEVQATSVCPEFVLTLEQVSFYRENEASLLFKLRNSGDVDIQKMRIRMKVGDDHHEKWAPIMEDKSFEIIRKDELLCIDWPVLLNFIPEPEFEIKPNIELSYTGGDLKEEYIVETIEDIKTMLMPFIDISVAYPSGPLKPSDSIKLYGREDLLRTLNNSFTNSGQTQYPFLEGVRKVGKTSILYFLANRLPDSILPVYINMTTSWTNPYQLLAEKIIDEIFLRSSIKLADSSKIVSIANFDRFLVDLKQKAGMNHILLLLDEFHSVVDRIENGSLNSNFLGDLRNIYQNKNNFVYVAFADWHYVDELKTRIREAELWNDFDCVPITFLNELDTREAILSPANDQVRFEQDAISRIYYYTNGYPWHVQWICSQLISHLNTQKRYIVISQDIDLLARMILSYDRYFDQGLCRSERITKNMQSIIYGILEKIKESNGDICANFERTVAFNKKLPFDVRHETSKLIQLEILQKRDNRLRFCSPLHAMWFEAKRQNGEDIYCKNQTEKDETIHISPFDYIHNDADLSIEEDPTKNSFILENEILKLFSSTHQKFRNEGASDVNSKTLEHLKLKLIDLTTLNKNIKWLDVGCGDGRSLDVLEVIRKREIINYHGIDGAHKHLDHAEKNANDYGLLNPIIEKMNADNMNFDSEFDIISAVLLFHEVDPLSLPFILRNMIKALKVDGTLVISDFQEPYEREKPSVVWTADDIKHLLEKICINTEPIIEIIPAGIFSDEFRFYRGYIKKSDINETAFKEFMQQYDEFLLAKKEATKQEKETLKGQIKDRVCGILKRKDVDTKNLSREEMKNIMDKIEDIYKIKAYKIDLLTSQIEFLDEKIAEFRERSRRLESN